MTAGRRFWWAIAAIALVGLVLRLHGVHDPIFDHPGWRQGDTAAIARNFATLNDDPLYPQTDYDGPPPNYVELELQIVPWIAAQLYKVVGVHEIIGRLLSIAFGTATIVLVGVFGRWLFASALAGIAAAAAYAVFPGAWYYSRTFMPDTTMVFFLTGALYVTTRWIVDDDAAPRRAWGPALLLTAAFLAKPVAVVALVPLAAVAVARFGFAGIVRRWAPWAVALVPLLVLAGYDHAVSSHAEWHWASGITRLHVIPGLVGAFTSGHAFVAKLAAFGHALRMLATTMVGPLGIVLAVAGLCVVRGSRSDALLWGWLVGGLLYAYVVVTVEKVDYYLYPLVPLAALAIGRLAQWVDARLGTAPRHRSTLAGIGAAVWLAGLAIGWSEIKPYFAWSRVNYAAAKTLSRTLAPGTLVVMGHDDPSIIYTIDRKGWEEDPKLWTPFDEQSAIRKGARYYIAVEHKRLRQTNLELYCWLSRFPTLDVREPWPVYVTDPARVKPGAEDRWRAFRRREMAGAFAGWSRAGWKTAQDPCR